MSSRQSIPSHLFHRINIDQSFNFSTLPLLFPAQFMGAIHSFISPPSLPSSSWHLSPALRADLSSWSTLPFFPSTFYTSLHLNPSRWSLPLSLLPFLSVCADRWIAGRSISAASWHRNHCWKHFSFYTAATNLGQEWIRCCHSYWVQTNAARWGRADWHELNQQTNLSNWHFQYLYIHMLLYNLAQVSS